MVSFRYHLVSIVAVFLALGLGVLMGTTVVKQGVIETLRTQANNAIDTTHRLQKDVSDLRSELSRWQAMAGPAQRLMIAGQLKGTTVVLVTDDGVDPSVIDGVRGALDDANATVSAVLRVTSRMQLTDETVRTELASTLGLPDTTDPADLARQAAEGLAVRLADGPPVTGPTADVLDQLSGQGLVEHPELNQGLQQVGGPDQAVIVLTGGSGPPAVEPRNFFVPFVDSLVASNAVTVAAEATTTEYEFVALVRRDGAVDGRVVTVDDAEFVAGHVALVLGLRDLLESNLGACSDFGFKAGACATFPPPLIQP